MSIIFDKNLGILEKTIEEIQKEKNIFWKQNTA